MKATPMKSAQLALTAALLLAAAGTASAGTPYDGPWNVTITTQRGECDSGLGFGVDIRDGVVHGYGGVAVSGRVSRSGAVSVRISSGGSNAAGTGRLSASSGRGVWRGNGSRGACTGSWVAARR
jgi:hypothetical protein